MSYLAINNSYGLTGTEILIYEAIKEKGKLSHYEISELTPGSRPFLGNSDLDGRTKVHVCNINRKIKSTGYALFNIRNYGYCYDKIQKPEEADRHAI